jgi:hypothetical protein
MVLRSSRDLFKDRHRRLGVVPAIALPIAGVSLVKTAATGPCEVVNPCRQNVYNSCADQCIILNVACV